MEASSVGMQGLISILPAAEGSVPDCTKGLFMMYCLLRGMLELPAAVAWPCCAQS